MSQKKEDIGESTITLEDAPTGTARSFYFRLGSVLLLASLGYLTWRIVTPLWQPLLWATLLGSPTGWVAAPGSRARSRPR